MGLRDKLKARDDKAQAEKALRGEGNDLPEGVKRYVSLGRELKDGREFVIIADPDNWFAYYVHEDGDFATRTDFIQKHTCLHSPKLAGVDFEEFDKPNSSVCLTCKAMKSPKYQRKLYFVVPVYDVQYGTYRFLDLKEFHVNNIVTDYDKLEKAARKFNKEYTLVGDAVVIKKKDKTYSLESADTDGLEQAIEDAKKYTGISFDFAEQVNFRDEASIREIIGKADGDKFDKSVLDGLPAIEPKAENVGAPIDISDDDLPF